MLLPNMTEGTVANSIVDWMDPSDDPRPDGAENDDYYQTQNTPLLVRKNGPLDTLEELLLVKV